jgi:hypothetical protein
MAKKASKAPTIEVIPSHRDATSALASANVPFIYFDTAINFGFHNQMAYITLDAFRYNTVGNALLTDRVVVAHLRMTFPALQSLKEAIEGIALLVQPTQEGQPH